MSGKELVKLLKTNGWAVDRINGSHYVMKKGGEIEIVPVHGKKRHTTRTIKQNIKKDGAGIGPTQ